ncbi:hypothetical protein Scep_006935 [Stephania cephalantha]|uniref:NmrA-like domain-containing protein n=1 Tax=Stephania cephalantha TaxID=152367 RepID=A0AAP0PKK4_9MAGN
MAREKSKVLVLGGTGYLGKRLVKASLREGHPTFVLQRNENVMDINKIQALLRLRKRGVQFIEASVSNHESLVRALKQVDVVVSALPQTSGPSLEYKVIDAIKEAGNIKRYVPAEYSIDTSRRFHTLEPAKGLAERILEVRKAVQNANIPYTSISANLFAGWYAPNLLQIDTLLPPKDKVSIYGDGNAKVIILDEDDVAIYTIKTLDDPRTINKTLHLVPPENIVSQNELIEIWEKLIGKKLEKSNVSREDFLAIMEGADTGTQLMVSYTYPICFEGCLTNYEIGEGEEGSKLYPDVKYTRVDEYLKRYL